MTSYSILITSSHKPMIYRYTGPELGVGTCRVKTRGVGLGYILRGDIIQQLDNIQSQTNDIQVHRTRTGGGYMQGQN